jgi:hypothetical protein
MIAQMSGKVVTFVCIFREYIKKKTKKKTTENTKEEHRERAVVSLQTPSLALPHAWGRELVCVGWRSVTPWEGAFF